MTMSNTQALQHARENGYAGAIRVLEVRVQSERSQKIRDNIDYCAEYFSQFRKRSKAEFLLREWAEEQGGEPTLAGNRHLATVERSTIIYKRMGA